MDSSAGIKVFPRLAREYSTVGGINDQTYAIYDQLAKGGIGAIITGFTSVSLHDYYFGGMMRLCDDSLIDQYKHLTELIHKEHVR